MKNQSQLGRQNFTMQMIINDSENTLEDEFINLEQVPESFINSVYETSYDEMTSEEKQESIDWIKEQLESNMK